MMHYKSTMNIRDLPMELNYDVLLQLDYESLISLCNSSKYYRNICGDMRFW